MELEQFRFLVPGWRDLIQIAIVAFLLYRLLLFIAGTRALEILVGVLVLAAAYVAALLLKFNMIATLLSAVFTYGAFAAIVVFQPELRHALARLGRSRAMSFLVANGTQTVADEVAEAVERLARAGTGAIIVIERDVTLGDILETGTAMTATVTADLLATIFTPYSPLHDGAVVIRGENIIAAGCVLPLTQFPVSDRSLGTRHRAALGLSEESDAMVIVVSEETSTISIARRGVLEREVTPAQVRELLAGRREPAAPSDASENAPATT